MISVSMVGADTYLVAVEGSDGAAETEHRVEMSQDYYRQLCDGRVTHEWVLIQSCKFLLEREPSSSILAEFKLQQIADYFPEYEETITQRLNAGTR